MTTPGPITSHKLAVEGNRDEVVQLFCTEKTCDHLRIFDSSVTVDDLVIEQLNHVRYAADRAYAESRPNVDTESSASRQHYIETGAFMTHDEVKAFKS